MVPMICKSATLIGRNPAVWQAALEPFDQVTEAVTMVEQNLRFPGQYLDRESGLHYNYFRTYDPAIGRYTQSDPIGLGGGINTVGYVGGNPVQRVDPLGLAPPSNIPFTADINRNIAEARTMTYRKWHDAVRNGGKWDYKQKDSKYEAFGNYNFGLTARELGLAGNIPNRGAGWAQERAGTSDPSWGSWYDWPTNTSYGDDPFDQYWINEGIRDSEWDYHQATMCYIF